MAPTFVISAVSLLLLLEVSLFKANTIKEIKTCDASVGDEVTIPKSLTNTNSSLQFRTTVQDIRCPSGDVVNKSSTTHPTEATFHFYPSGDIRVDNTEYLLRDDYCIARYNENAIQIKHCDVECGITHTCLTKCCPPHAVVDFSEHPTGVCKPSKGSAWTPVFYDSYDGCGVRTENPRKAHFLPVTAEVVYSEYQPYKNIKIKGEKKFREGQRFRLMHNGDLFVYSSVTESWVHFNNSEFCIDGMTGYISSGNVFSGKLFDQVFLDWAVLPDDQADFTQFNFTNISDSYPDDATNEEDGIDQESHQNDEERPEIEIIRAYIYISLFLLGAVFLFATAVLYLFIWDKHNIHGWTIFAFVTTMWFMYIFLATSHVVSLTINLYNDFAGHPACEGVGIGAHFFYLSTMCWLTVINVDLWLTFRNLKPGGRKSQNVTRFVLYTLFGYGVPTLVVALGVAVDTVYKDSFGDGSECEPPLVVPLYGKSCYIQGKAIWEYLLIPMSILLSCNILTFSSTVFSLIVYRNQTRNASGGLNASHHKESIALFGKLFVVTGVSWALEILSHVFPEPIWFWIIIDAYNLLQAVLIFIIFGLKRENIVFLYHKYPSARFLLIPIMRTRCCFAATFDPERTEMTGVSMTSARISYRRGSNLSTTSASAQFKR